MLFHISIHISLLFSSIFPSQFPCLSLSYSNYPTLFSLRLFYSALLCLSSFITFIFLGSHMQINATYVTPPAWRFKTKLDLIFIIWTKGPIWNAIITDSYVSYVWWLAMQMLALKSKINSNVPNDKPNWQRQFTHNKSVKFSLKPGHPNIHTHTHTPDTHTPDTHTGASNFKCCQFPSQFNAKTDRPLSIYVSHIICIWSARHLFWLTIN